MYNGFILATLFTFELPEGDINLTYFHFKNKILLHLQNL